MHMQLTHVKRIQQYTSNQYIQLYIALPYNVEKIIWQVPNQQVVIVKRT